MRDLLVFLDNHFLLAQTMFYTDYQDFFIFTSYHSPELVLALNDFFLNYFSNATINSTPSTVFDIYSDNLNISFSEFIEYFLLFFTFVWATILFIVSSRINK
jgi:hypothetical protein